MMEKTRKVNKSRKMVKNIIAKLVTNNKPHN